MPQLPIESGYLIRDKYGLVGVVDSVGTVNGARFYGVQIVTRAFRSFLVTRDHRLVAEQEIERVSDAPYSCTAPLPGTRKAADAAKATSAA